MAEERGAGHRCSPRPGALLGAALVAAAVVLAGCSDSSGDAPAGDPPGAACPAPSAAPAAETALLPAGMSFDRIGTVTQVRKASGRITARAVTTKPLDEVTVLIQDAVTAAGYRPAGMDSEESEAEVFFTVGTYAAGQARVRQAACAGSWDIDLDLIDPAAVPTSSASPSATATR